MRCRHNCAILFALTFFVAHAAAQIERVLPRRGGSSLEGTSFVVGFMANEILEVGEDPRVQIFISSQVDATVTISSPLSSPYTYVIPANTVRVFSMNAMHVVNASEQIAPKAIFVDSDVPIVVYTLNSLALSTDSYTAIPTKHCGTDYFTVNRPTDWYKPGRTMNPLDRAPRVGEFMVMATEDATDVVIQPRVRTRGGRSAGQQFSVRLNKGDCYLVQAQATRHGGDDLTGSSISSNLPIAVISGHIRSGVPTDSTLSKDHLVEQLPPVTKWGRTYATAQFAQIVRPDVFRMVASRSNQTVRLTTSAGTSTFTLSAPGSWRDTSLKEPAYWTSDEPFLLTQFMSSSTSGAYGDPAMVIVPPVEQFVNQSMFQFPVLETTGLDNQQFFYFINVVAEASALSSLRVNTMPVTTIAPQIRTQTIPGTTLHWATLQLSEGAFQLQADTGLFSGVMYGTSIVDSYANMVGVAYDSIRPDDVSPPRYRVSVDCGEITGVVTDSSATTARLDNVRVIQSRTVNYRWSIAPPADDSSTVEIWAQVKDLWRDARIVFHAYDDQGNGRELLYTYDAPNVSVPPDVVIDATGAGLQCTTAVLYNRDSTPTTIVRATITGDARLSIAAPVIRDTILAPGDSLTITVCVRRTSDTSQARGTIIVEYPCRLQRFINVRTATVAALSTVPLDVGDVRIGDTVCRRLPVINTGPSTVIVTALLLQKSIPNFLIDASRLRLPVTLQPNDTLWIDVCFTPDRLGPFERSDTVRSLPDCGLRTTMRGRGVAPEIASIVIDWQQRRVGGAYDTTVVLRNTGSGWAVLDGWTAWSDSSVTTRGPSTSQRIAAGDSLVLTAKLMPRRRGRIDHVDTLAVDWKLHPTLTVRHVAVGVLPDVRGIDCDFGPVDLGRNKDSLVDHLVSGGDGGNVEVDVRSVRVLGPDSSAFDIPASLRDLRSIPSVDTIRARTQFTPVRSGLHVCAIEVRHNGRIGDADSVTQYVLKGTGVIPTSARLNARLSATASVVACQRERIEVLIRNEGDGIGRIDTVELTDGQRREVLYASAAGQNILPGGEQRWNLDWIFDRASPTRLWMRVVDSVGSVTRDSVDVQVTLPQVALALNVPDAPSLVAGPTELLLQASLQMPQAVSTAPAVVLSLPHERFAATSQVVRVMGVSQFGSIDTSVFAQQTADGIRLTLPECHGAWEVTVRVPGMWLWRDPAPFSFSAAIEASECYDGAATVLDQLQIAPCGAAARVIRLSKLPSVTATVVRMPVQEELHLRLETTAPTTVSIAVESLTGQSFQLVEGFSLQKGVEHCNFSCSGWASGVYLVRIQGSSGETDCKVIIVN